MAFYALGDKTGIGAAGTLTEMLQQSPNSFASNVKQAVFEDQDDRNAAQKVRGTLAV